MAYQALEPKDQELILRFFALHDKSESYWRPMKGFLNRYMEEHRNASSETILQLRGLFENTVEIAATYLTRSSFRPKQNLNAAVVDSLLVGLSHRLEAGSISAPESLKERVAKRS